jgi:hypothetical protein
VKRTLTPVTAPSQQPAKSLVYTHPALAPLVASWSIVSTQPLPTLNGQFGSATPTPYLLWNPTIVNVVESWFEIAGVQPSLAAPSTSNGRGKGKGGDKGMSGETAFPSPSTSTNSPTSNDFGKGKGGMGVGMKERTNSPTFAATNDPTCPQPAASPMPSSGLPTTSPGSTKKKGKGDMSTTAVPSTIKMSKTKHPSFNPPTPATAPKGKGMGSKSRPPKTRSPIAIQVPTLAPQQKTCPPVTIPPLPPTPTMPMTVSPNPMPIPSAPINPPLSSPISSPAIGAPNNVPNQSPLTMPVLMTPNQIPTSVVPTPVAPPFPTPVTSPATSTPTETPLAVPVPISTPNAPVLTSPNQTPVLSPIVPTPTAPITLVPTAAPVLTNAPTIAPVPVQAPVSSPGTIIPTIAPVPVPVSSPGTTISASPFQVVYDPTPGSVTAANFVPAIDLTCANVEKSIMDVVNLSPFIVLSDIRCEPTTTTTAPTTITYDVVVIFDTSSTVIPTTSDIDQIINVSFQSPQVDTLISDLNLLPSDNPFSSTTSATYMIAPAPIRKQDQIIREEPLEFTGSYLLGATAFVGIFLLLVAAIQRKYGHNNSKNQNNCWLALLPYIGYRKLSKRSNSKNRMASVATETATQSINDNPIIDLTSYHDEIDNSDPLLLPPKQLF